MTRTTLAGVLVLCLWGAPVRAQLLAQRGFVQVTGFAFPQEAPNDTQHLVGDFLGREELFVKPAPWLQFAAGLDARANTHDQVDYAFRLDVRDRGVRRPALSVRRLTATIAHGPLTIDVGKQFIRWGKADIVTPTDRFAPRDFVDVVDTELLAVSGARAVLQLASNTLDAVWVPQFTPSRLPLIGQRWSVVPPAAAPARLVDAGGETPAGSQWGIRWGHVGAGYEYSVSLFDGYNHLPNIDVRQGSQPFEIAIARTYPPLRSYGVDAAVPGRWFTVKGEASYFTSSSTVADEYVLYVLQLERQTGEWLLVGGYAGEAVTNRRAPFAFAPDRGLTHALLARASYTINTNRSAAFETAVRENGRGLYAKGEYSQARGQHWRATLAGVLVRGREDDFLGQYRRNSHVSLALRYSF